LPEWILLGSGLAAFIIMSLGLQKFFITPRREERQAILFQESAMAVAVVHMVSVITRRGPSEAWTMAGIALYLTAIVLYLGALEATGGAMLPRAFAASEADTPLLTNGIYQLVRHPIYLAYSLAWLAAPVATHGPTATVTALVMVALHVVAARRQDELLAKRWGEEYRRYRRWWR
jgi:protein-S-isoprenylcysteine O-methyltransferase Ste14